MEDAILWAVGTMGCRRCRRSPAPGATSLIYV